MKKTPIAFLLLCFLFCLAACNQLDAAHATSPTTNPVGSSSTPTQAAQATNKPGTQPVPTSTVQAAGNPATEPTPAPTQTTQHVSNATTPAATPGFAATFGGGGPQSDPLPAGITNPNGNSFVIESPADRPVALIMPTTLHVPLRAQFAVFVTNDSSSPHTLVSDTPYGWRPFTIPPHSYTTLTFKRSGTFKGHLQEFPAAQITLIIPGLSH